MFIHHTKTLKINFFMLIWINVKMFKGHLSPPPHKTLPLFWSHVRWADGGAVEPRCLTTTSPQFNGAGGEWNHNAVYQTHRKWVLLSEDVSPNHILPLGSCFRWDSVHTMYSKQQMQARCLFFWLSFVENVCAVCVCFRLCTSAHPATSHKIWLEISYLFVIAVSPTCRLILRCHPPQTQYATLIYIQKKGQKSVAQNVFAIKKIIAVLFVSSL